jgi:hypothetical protein
MGVVDEATAAVSNEIEWDRGKTLRVDNGRGQRMDGWVL